MFLRFNSGLELANLAVNSNLLHLSLNAIYTLQSEADPNQQQRQSLSLRWKFEKQQSNTIIAFVTSPCCTVHHLQEGADLVSSATLKQENFNHFEFLCSKGNPSFSVNRAAIALFYQSFDDFSRLKTQLIDSATCKLLVDTPLIVAGNSLGGSLASLFTLWLLDSINPSSKSKRPLCITFGSPLLGDSGLQRAISERSTWNSCFLNVAANQDPVPCLFIPPLTHQYLASTPQTAAYRPFGAFLLCSHLGCACAEDPEVVACLLAAMGLESTRSQVSGEQLLTYYGTLVENLKTRVILKGSSGLSLSVMDSLQAGFILQLEAIGDQRIQQQQHNMDIADLIKKLKQREQICMLNKRKALNPSRKLNEIKIKMAYLEWYKKTCKKKMGYYDSYKSLLSTSDREITKHKKFLTNYWKDMVEEAEKKPQKEGSFIRGTWLYAGMNYRRMVEPLDIAEYYREKGRRNYESEGRSKHYILLEKWQKEDIEKPTGPASTKKKQNVAGSLTEDSCFWAYVEEALISSEVLKDATSSAVDKQSSREYLSKFETYVMDQINNYAVSPEIFLRESSFMKWWRGFQDVASNSSLLDFMKNARYVQYEKGCF
ncbi:senescence-associated carboxylesterase 101 isoform X2 [Ricinus communis]|uniref:senescence-associated carboxylesterase 101 isoform X2 n=1 Tax=Ricinus communis TaxID=3988 RepID=UPI000772C87A|nr:senescence-associated carboxylesterase 101 isoform X2 [Ricinus communis]|eukprot:XP_015573661.1 senescence-associated carboxylesterase 101 isoform X2 [Ricinus communis]